MDGLELTRHIKSDIQTSHIPVILLTAKGNEEDFTACLGLEVAGADKNLTVLPIDGFKNMIKTAVAKYPNFKAVATTLRTVKTATVNDWSAILWFNGEFYKAAQRDGLEIYDRVGVGDSFASGLIYAMMRDYKPMDLVNFAVASSVIKHTIHGDANITDNADAIKAIMNMNFDIKR